MSNDLETADEYIVNYLWFGDCDDNCLLEVQRYNKRFNVIIKPENLEKSPTIKSQYLRYLNAQRADVDDDGQSIRSDCSVDPDGIYDWALNPCLPLFKELSPQPEHQTAKMSLFDYYNAETFHYFLHTVNDKLTLVTNPKGNCFSPPGVELPPDVIHPSWPVYKASDVFLDITNSYQALCPKPGKVVIQHSRNREEVRCFFKPYSHGDRNRAILEVANYRKITESTLVPDARICRLEGVVKDEMDRLMGLLLTYIDCGYTTLACAADEETPDSVKERWVEQIKETLAQLHAAGLLWGDAKPQNVLITAGDGSVNDIENGDAWLIDFGGGYTPGFVDKEMAGTVQGDLQGLGNIVKYVFEGREA